MAGPKLPLQDQNLEDNICSALSSLPSCLSFRDSEMDYNVTENDVSVNSSPAPLPRMQALQWKPHLKLARSSICSKWQYYLRELQPLKHLIRSSEMQSDEK